MNVAWSEYQREREKEEKKEMIMLTLTYKHWDECEWYKEVGEII